MARFAISCLGARTGLPTFSQLSQAYQECTGEPLPALGAGLPGE